jgi:hypothetical protein
MLIVERRNALLAIGFAGALIWSGGLINHAAAADAAKTVAAPRTGFAENCTVLSPRFEPGQRLWSPAAPASANTLGGAKLRSLVAEPCLRASSVRGI